MHKNFYQLVEKKKLLFVTGKGGIGKSLISSALASYASAQGRKVLLVQQAATDHLGPIFGDKTIGHEKVLVRPNLRLANFDANKNFSDFIKSQLKTTSFFEPIANSGLVKNFFMAIPGLKEVMFLGRLYYELTRASDVSDLVIVDGFSSGHFLSLMTTPQSIIDSGLGGPIVTQTTSILDFLKDSRVCGSIIVGIPEELVITEMLEFAAILSKSSPLELSGIVFNRVLSENMEISERAASVQKYLKNRIAQQHAALRFWSEKSKAVISPSVFQFFIPDLGYVPEPLDSLYVEKIVKGGV